MFLVPDVGEVVRSCITHSALPSFSTHTMPCRHITQKYLRTILQYVSGWKHYLMDDHNKRRLQRITSCCSTLTILKTFSSMESCSLQISKRELSVIFSNTSTANRNPLSAFNFTSLMTSYTPTHFQIYSVSMCFYR